MAKPKPKPKPKPKLKKRVDERPAKAKRKPGGSGLGAHNRDKGREPAIPKSRFGHKQNARRPRMRISESNAEILRTGDLSGWDEEELLRGQRRDRRGNFSGRPPKLVPKLLHDELVRRTLEEANEIMRTNLKAAVTVLTELALDPDVEPKDRLKAIESVMNRVMGRPPEKVELTATVKPWEEALSGGVVRDLEWEDDGDADWGEEEDDED